MHQLTDSPLLVCVLSVVTLWVAALIGASVLRRQRQLDEDVRETFGVIRAATLTLLGLIIGFSFSMAVSRYDERKNDEAAEANAIGTEYVRAALLPAAAAATVRAVLGRYLEQRILFYTTRDERQLGQITAQTARVQAELWAAVQAPRPPRSQPPSSRWPWWA
jgi:cation transport ATPase